MACVSEAAVLALLRGTLPIDERLALEAHLDACAECLELVTLASKTSLATGATVEAAPEVLVPRTRIGRYEILEPLGRGGMGAVYAARDTQLERRVAIKLVNPAVASDDAAQLCLLREAQALARITQPNVLTVYDMGTYDDSIFLAAELVDGETLDAWCARPRRWRQIVEVFLQAARGLEAAHAAGLVHRDFKPSNAMIGRDGRVRVFDFGLVRFVDTVASGRELAGTPLYMAPEQLRGEVADARSDQYALCVALYEALYGEHPVMRLPLDAPRRPPVIGKPPRWLRDALERGLAHEAVDRFPTVAMLRMAIERGLGRRRRWLVAGAAATALAIAAITTGVGYARGKQEPLSRCPEIEPPLPSVAAALQATGVPYAARTAAHVDAALARFAGQWQREARDACLAYEVHETDDAERHARRTACLDRDRLVFEAIVDRFAQADRQVAAQSSALLGALPDVALCSRADGPAWPAEPSARVRLTQHFQELARIRSLAEAGKPIDAARDVARLARDASRLGEPRAEADATYLAGHIAGLLGHYADGARQVEQALWAAQAAGNDELVVTAACELMWLIGNRQRKPEDARPFVELARATAERVGTNAARARAARAIGNLELAAAHFEIADTMLARAKELDPGIDPMLGALIDVDLANLDSHRGRHTAAEQRLREVEARVARELGEDNPRHAQILNNLGNALLDLARHAEAAQVFDRGIAIMERALGPEHPDVGQLLVNGASSHIQSGDLTGAAAQLERAVALFARIDPESPIRLTALNNLAEVRRITGARADAEALHREVLALRKKRLDPHHPQITQSLLNVASLVLDRGGVAEATALCDEAAQTGSPNPALQAEIAICLGETAAAAGDGPRAIGHLEHALALAGSGEDSGRLADAQFSLARALPPAQRARAVELARAARTGYAREPAFHKAELALVDAWLARTSK